jgi:hypothetical protein
MIYGVDYENQNCGAPERPLKCGSCYQTVEELFDCTWDPTLQVGACCAVHPDELESSPRIEARPVRLVSTAQGRLFGKEVA